MTVISFLSVEIMVVNAIKISTSHLEHWLADQNFQICPRNQVFCETLNEKMPRASTITNKGYLSQVPPSYLLSQNAELWL